MARAPLNPRRLLLALTAALVVTALLPARATGWAEWLRNPLNFVLAPVAHPVSRLTTSVRPADGDAPDDPRVADLEVRLDSAKTRLAQAQRRIETLERLVRDLQAGMAVAPGPQPRTFRAAIIGASPDPSDGTIIANRGRAQGVVANQTVAVAAGVQLVGRVVDASRRTSRVLPITHPDSRFIGAMVMTDDPRSGYAALLEPVGEGRLAGDMVGEATGIEAGQVVRLSDESWPASSQMFVIGRVVEVQRKENQRLRVVVEPELDVARVSEVILRAPREDDGEAAP